jgi:hypothetical protein
MAHQHRRMNEHDASKMVHGHGYCAPKARLLIYNRYNERRSLMRDE